MNFINFNPEGRFPGLAFKPDNLPPVTDYKVGQGFPAMDNAFENMLAEIFDEVSAPDSEKRIDEEKIENKKTDRKEETALEEKERKEKQAELDRLSKLLAILEKLIQKKDLTSSEQAYLASNKGQNNGLFKELIGELKQLAGGKTSLADSPLFAKIFNGEAGKLPPQALEQIQKLSEILKHLKDAQGNLNTKNTGSSQLTQLEKIADLLKLNGRDGQIKLEDVYIKNQDRFNVLKGDEKALGNKPLDPADLTSQSTRATGTEELRANSTHQKATPSNNNNNNGANNGVGMGQVQKNLVINVKSGGEGMNFSGGFSQSQSPLASSERASGMFTQNSFPQSINFKSLIQYLTGKVHNGFVSGKQVMLVKLQPENLGQVQVLLKREGENSLHLKLKVDSQEIKELLDKSGQDIRTGLSKDNLDLLSFDVDVSGRSGSAYHREKGESSNEKKFNEFSSVTENQVSGEENIKTVDLRVRSNLLNIKI